MINKRDIKTSNKVNNGIETKSRREVNIRREAKRTLVIYSIILIAILAVTGSILFSTTKAQAAPVEHSYKYYTSIQIQKGDTLWSIADSYITDEYVDKKAYIQEICSINNISQDAIHSGQYITIPYYSSDYLE